MTIDIKNEENLVILEIEGRIDSNTSSHLQEKLMENIDNGKNVLLDFENATYISSAGLRVLLIGQKTATAQKITMQLTNVSEIVMQVLETVGFAKILSFKK